jgi:hypothetical protein
MFTHEEKPVAAPGHITGNFADAGNVHDRSLCLAIAGHIGNRNLAAGVQCGRDNANGRFNPVLTGFYFSEMRQRNNQANGPVAAHGQTADVVEENDASPARFIRRLNQQCTHKYIGTPWFVDHCGTKLVMLFAKDFQAVSNTAAAQIRCAGNNDTRRLPTSMRINDRYPFHFSVLFSLWNLGPVLYAIVNNFQNMFAFCSSERKPGGAHKLLAQAAFLHCQLDVLDKLGADIKVQ